MVRYVDLDKIVAEINKRIKDAPIDCYGHQRVWAYNDVKDILNTLEVKEVDLDKEIDFVEDKYHGFYSLSRADIIDVARHFFELGLKAQKGE